MTASPRLYVYRRAGAVVIDGDHVLLVSMQPPGQRRWWLFPGGGIEEGESPQEAAERELLEETGLRAVRSTEYLRAGVHGGEHDYFLVECDDLAIGAVTGPELEYAADADFRAEWVPIDRLASIPVFPRCVAEHVAEHGAATHHVPWYEDDRVGAHGVAGVEPPTHLRYTARSVIIDSGRVAAIERIRDGQRYHTLPGGGLDSDESVEDAAIRETKEELGLDVVARSKLAVVALQLGERESLQTFVWCEIVGGTFGTGVGAEYSSPPSSPAGSYRPVWLDIDDLPVDLRPQWLHDRLPTWLTDNAPVRPERFNEHHGS